MSSTNQYLRPDYMNPLPTTLDAKRSPLALLAQTCSQIGADPPAPSKSSSDRKKSSFADTSRDKLSPVNVNVSGKTTPKNSESPRTRERDTYQLGPDVKASTIVTPGVSAIHSSSSSVGPLSSGSHGKKHSSTSSHQHGHSKSQRTSPPCAESHGEVSDRHVSKSPAKDSRDTSISVSRASPVPTSDTFSNSGAALKYSPAYGNGFYYPSPAAADPNSYRDSPFGNFKPGYMSVFPPFSPGAGLPPSPYAYPGFPGGYPSLDSLASLGPYASALSAAGKSSGHMNFGLLSPSYSPFAQFGRLKPGAGPEAGSPGMPGCRDPYCTGCPNSLLMGAIQQHQQHLNNSAASFSAAAQMHGVCPLGCAQCDHPKLLLGPQSAQLSQSPISSSNNTPAVTTTAAGSTAAYNPTTTSSKPYICNWIAADTYCGKRFTSSEELLQHLRTHTNLSIAESSSANNHSSLINPSPASFLHPGSAASHPLFPTSVSMAASLQRPYPTPPLSPLAAAAAAARYHPYNKAGPPSHSPATNAPPAGLASLFGMPFAAGAYPNLPLHSSMSPYYSPFALYGPRLGATPLQP